MNTEKLLNRQKTLINLIDAHVADLQPEEAKDLLLSLRLYIKAKIHKFTEQLTAEFPNNDGD